MCPVNSGALTLLGRRLPLAVALSSSRGWQLLGVVFASLQVGPLLLVRLVSKRASWAAVLLPGACLIGSCPARSIDPVWRKLAGRLSAAGSFDEASCLALTSHSAAGRSYSRGAAGM